MQIHSSLKFKPSFNFYQVLPGIFLTEIKGNDDLAMTFLRVQEFYESANPDFQGHAFTLEEYKAWYKTQSKTGEFTYGEDWRGFNIPSNAIEKCYEAHVERLDTDLFFLELCRIASQMSQKSGLSSYYMLGVREGDIQTLDHEIAHGLFTTNPQYKNETLKLISQFPSEVTEYMTKYLNDLGYAYSVVPDEIQAYLSTGLRGDMDANLLTPYMDKFQKIFKQAVGVFSVDKLQPVIKTI